MTLVLVVDDEPDVETLFRQQFRRDLHGGRFRIDRHLADVIKLRGISAKQPIPPGIDML
jgi:hypothetical protein